MSLQKHVNGLKFEEFDAVGAFAGCFADCERDLWFWEATVVLMN
ncbi:MAG: hypothetical protein ACTS4U_00960 [Candidatus Hodgkinia cicadicola]